MKLADRISKIKPSATLEMTAKAAELKSKGIEVFNMSVGEPDFNTPNNIINAAIKAMNTGHTRYTPGSGTKNLKNAIKKKLIRDNKLDYSLDEIIISSVPTYDEKDLKSVNRSGAADDISDDADKDSEKSTKPVLKKIKKVT